MFGVMTFSIHALLSGAGAKHHTTHQKKITCTVNPNCFEGIENFGCRIENIGAKPVKTSYMVASYSASEPVLTLYSRATMLLLARMRHLKFVNLQTDVFAWLKRLHDHLDASL